MLDTSQNRVFAQEILLSLVKTAQYESSGANADHIASGILDGDTEAEWL